MRVASGDRRRVAPDLFLDRTPPLFEITLYRIPGRLPGSDIRLHVHGRSPDPCCTELSLEVA
jgi:hypothetical protein